VKCPFCSAEESKVVDSRSGDDNIRRRRECLCCKGRFTTYERVEKQELMVVKRSGKRETYDEGKVLAGIVRACERRPVDKKIMKRIAEEITMWMQEAFEGEVRSIQIGEKVMEKLLEIDAVAYIRFASVYKDFSDLDSFIQIIDQIREGEHRRSEKCDEE